MAWIPTRAAGVFVLLTAVAWVGAGRARADCDDGGTCGAPPEPRYTLTLTTALHHASRSDFSRPIFLLQQPPARIEILQLRTALKLDLDVTAALALHAEVPFAFNRTEVELVPVVVSADQVLQGSTHELSGAGLADPTLAASYRWLKAGRWRGRAAIGTSIPIDDNPGSNTFPRRIPSSTGQTEVFAELQGIYAASRLSVSLDNRLSLYPGNAATYLVRRLGNQSYTSGSLAYHLRYRIRLEVAWRLSRLVSVLVTPDWELREQPRLLEPDGARAFLPEAAVHEIGLRLGLRLHLGRQHQLELSYRELFLESWRKDPFFPIRVPARGVALTWGFWGL